MEKTTTELLPSNLGNVIYNEWYIMHTYNYGIRALILGSQMHVNVYYDATGIEDLLRQFEHDLEKYEFEVRITNIYLVDDEV